MDSLHASSALSSSSSPSSSSSSSSFSTSSSPSSSSSSSSSFSTSSSPSSSSSSSSSFSTSSSPSSSSSSSSSFASASSSPPDPSTSSSFSSAPSVRFSPSRCQFCGSPRVSLLRVASRLRSCRACFVRAFEDDVLDFIRRFSLFQRGQKVAVCVSGGKDSAVLLHVLHTLNARENLGLSLHLLAVDEGIKGYRDHALAAVRRNSEVYNLPLHVVSYASLYQGWTMDRIAQKALGKGGEPPVSREAAVAPASSSPSSAGCGAPEPPAASCCSSPSLIQTCGCSGGGASVGPGESAEAARRDRAEKKSGTQAGRSNDFTHSCTFCGIFRRQAFERGAHDIGADVLCTGHNADDGAETFLMNILRGDVQRLPVSGAPLTGSREGPSVMRVKPLLASYQREVVLYAHFNRLDYFATECTYSGAAYRGLVRNFLSSLQDNQQQQRILDLLHAARKLWAPSRVSSEAGNGVVDFEARREGRSGDSEVAGKTKSVRRNGGGEAAAGTEVDVFLRETHETALRECTATAAAEDALQASPLSPASADKRETAAASISSLGGDLSVPSTASSASFHLSNAGWGNRGEGGLEKNESDTGPARNGQLRPCVLCGFLTKNDLCRACALVEALNENKLDFVGMNARKGNKLMRGNERGNHEQGKPSLCSERRDRIKTAVVRKENTRPSDLASQTPGLRGSLAW
ncbi:UNVERIFIED_CONTAM: PP-loop family protein [Hammondia hammondi]|eukprot:XP_008888114.1 PP-loop family protein [Hammondia hammondi]